MKVAVCIFYCQMQFPQSGLISLIEVNGIFNELLQLLQVSIIRFSIGVVLRVILQLLLGSMGNSNRRLGKRIKRK